MFAPAAERPWRDAWPQVARTGDGNPWVTGMCWLFCRRVGVAVLWVGSVTTPGASADVYSCGPCMAELDRMVRVQASRRDGHGDRAAQSATLAVPVPVPVHVPPPAGLPEGAPGGRGRHRAPRRAREAYATALPVEDDALTGTQVCEHRQTERRAGKTCCRDCKRQLYL